MIKNVKSLFSGLRQPDELRDPVSLTVAVCALLLEVAKADEVLSPEESERILRTLQVRFSLSPQEAHELVNLASRKREESSDLWSFTSRINEVLSLEEKRKVILEVWRVIYADGTLDAHEDYLVHKLAGLLNLQHSDLISAKLAARKEMGAE